MMNIDIKDIPPVFKPLFRKSRYKILYGGRGSGKSWQAATALILFSIQRKIRVLCCREVQKTIKESVHQLLEETVQRMGLDEIFHITEHAIKCTKTGSEFTFIGIAQNIRNMKSYQDYDYVWVEEGENITKESLDVMIPTIRKETLVSFPDIFEYRKFLGENPEINMKPYIDPWNKCVKIPSEIWILFNPENEDDPVYDKFINHRIDDAIIIKANYTENIHFPATLKKEMQRDKETDPIKYRHIWLGEPVGAGYKIYASHYGKHNILEEERESLYERIRNYGKCYMSIDPHSSYFPAVLWMAYVKLNDSQYEKIIYNEFPTYEYFDDYYHNQRHKKKCKLTLKELAELIRTYDGTEHGLNVRTRYIDTYYVKAAGGDNVMTDGKSVIETWKRPENGQMNLVCPSQKLLDIQRQNIISDLNYDREVPLSPFNRPRLYVAPWCLNTQTMLEKHRLTKDQKKEDERYKDFSDALRIMYAGTIEDIKERRPAKRKILKGRRTWMSR